jgi:hypothetical protein
MLQRKFLQKTAQDQCPKTGYTLYIFVYLSDADLFDIVLNI